MARGTKDGLDYFPLDVVMDDKVKLIEAKYDIVGFGVVVKLYQIIYENCYFVKWTEREFLLYKNRINVDINLINDIVKECLRWQIFHEGLFKKYNILTSAGIQKRYIEATKRRKRVTLIKEYLLIDVDVTESIHIINVAGKTVTEGKPPKGKFAHDSNEYCLAQLLLEKIRENKPDYKPNFSEANMQTWAKHIDLMIRIDKRDPSDIEKIIVLCQEDNVPRGKGNFCWAKNILSTEKLRKQFDQLEMKLCGGGNGGWEQVGTSQDPGVRKRPCPRKDCSGIMTIWINERFNRKEWRCEKCKARIEAK